MRKQTKIMQQLLNELNQLKQEIFGTAKFALVEETTKQKRYDQLFQFFNPKYRTKNYVSPL